MSGTKAGGQKTKYKNLLNNPDYYIVNGRKGGTPSRGHKFAFGKVDPRVIGRMGGKARAGRTYGQRHKAVE